MVVVFVFGFIILIDSLNVFYLVELLYYIEYCRFGYIGRDDFFDLVKGGNLVYDYVILKNDDFKLLDCLVC